MYLGNGSPSPVYLGRMPAVPRKALLAAAIPLLAAVATLVYMSRIEPDWLKSTAYDIARKEPVSVIPHLHDGDRIG